MEKKFFWILLRLIQDTSLGVFRKYMCLGTQSIDEGESRDVVNIGWEYSKVIECLSHYAFEKFTTCDKREHDLSNSLAP